jgi:energy-converting hydrogenase Eha subunit H
MQEKLAVRQQDAEGKGARISDLEIEVATMKASLASVQQTHEVSLQEVCNFAGFVRLAGIVAAGFVLCIAW